MANAHRGTVALQAGDRAYTLSFSVNALCELEDALDKPVAEIVATLQDPAKLRLGTVRQFLWAGLLDHHKDVTVEQAGEIATDAGFSIAVEKIGAAIELAFPVADKGAKGKKGNPPKAVGG